MGARCPYLCLAEALRQKMQRDRDQHSCPSMSHAEAAGWFYNVPVKSQQL